jgi:hypothetical protein
VIDSSDSAPPVIAAPTTPSKVPTQPNLKRSEIDNSASDPTVSAAPTPPKVPTVAYPDIYPDLTPLKI